MPSVTIYHNPRCSKSREALQLIEESGVAFEIVEYLKQPPSAEALAKLCKKLALEPLAIVRRNESHFRELEEGYAESLTPEQLLELLASHPELLQRPIVVCGDEACIARPPERVLEVLKFAAT